MQEDVYKQMFQAMAKRGGGYTGVDLPEFYDMVEELFTPEEAAANNAMPKGLFSAAQLAETLGKGERETTALLEAMADKGLCFSAVIDHRRLYAASRFLPGIFEFQFMRGTTTDRDRRIARVIHDYKQAVDALTGPTEIRYPGTRVIPVQEHIGDPSTVHTCRQMETYIRENEDISLSTCYCRHEAKLIDPKDDCGKPDDVCMQFGLGARYMIERGMGRRVTKEEARKVVKRAEEAGLVHCTVNSQDIDFICNCCSCHCVILRPVLQQPKPGLVLYSGFGPRFDGDLCTACGTCVDMCPTRALTLEEGELPRVDPDRCIGCSLCASNCPSQAVFMEERANMPLPPENMKALSQALKAAGG